MDGVRVLRKKEDEALLATENLKRSGLIPYLTETDSGISVIIHPGLVLNPERLRSVVNCCENPVIVFLRREAYARARSEFAMLCSISSSVGNQPEHYASLARQAIEHSQYDRLEAKVRMVCPRVHHLVIPYKDALSDPLVLLGPIRGSDQKAASTMASKVLRSQPDRNDSASREPLRAGILPRLIVGLYSRLILFSNGSYRIAKLAKRSFLGRIVMSRVRRSNPKLREIFDEEWQAVRTGRGQV